MAGNLGNYERIIHWSHTVRGPLALLGYTALVGYAVVRVAEFGATKAIQRIKEKNLNKDEVEETDPVTSS